MSNSYGENGGAALCAMPFLRFRQNNVELFRTVCLSNPDHSTLCFDLGCAIKRMTAPVLADGYPFSLVETFRFLGGGNG